MGARQALRHRDFARFFWAAAVSNAGAWMQIVALPAILFDLTDSATWLGVSSVASMLPAVILTPYAGVLVKVSGPGLALLVDAITFVLVIGALVASHPRTGAGSRPEGSVWIVMRGGASFVWQHRPLRLAMGIAFLAAVCGQAMQFMAPAVSERVFGHPSTDNAGLLVALGCGAVASWLFFQWSADRIRRSVRLAATLTLYPVSIAVIASTRHYPIGILGYTLNGLAHVQLAMSLNTLIQGSVPDHVRGRTTSFYVLGLLAGIPTGSFVIGRLADMIGMRSALLLDAAVFGAFAVFLAVTGRLRLMDVTRVGEHPDEGAELITAPGLAT
jgi:hypothetical protein